MTSTVSVKGYTRRKAEKPADPFEAHIKARLEQIRRNQPKAHAIPSIYRTLVKLMQRIGR